MKLLFSEFRFPQGFSGNIRGEWPYQQGNSCSNCPTGFQCIRNQCLNKTTTTTPITSKAMTTATLTTTTTSETSPSNSTTVTSSSANKIEQATSVAPMLCTCGLLTHGMVFIHI
uniref:Uncharacterized protein n=1 Tax=Mesocestoides corti TaxID=53468 RepID=A0A5K3F237_MESCO